MAPLSQSILNHPKQGFGVPISIWFKDNLKTYINDTFNSSNCLLYNFLDKKYIKEKIINNHIAGRDFSQKIWSLVIFQRMAETKQIMAKIMFLINSFGLLYENPDLNLG